MLAGGGRGELILTNVRSMKVLGEREGQRLVTRGWTAHGDGRRNDERTYLGQGDARPLAVVAACGELRVQVERSIEGNRARRIDAASSATCREILGNASGLEVVQVDDVRAHRAIRGGGPHRVTARFETGEGILSGGVGGGDRLKGAVEVNRDPGGGSGQQRGDRARDGDGAGPHRDRLPEFA